MTHPINRLNDDVHQRVRLGILAILDGASRADFRYLRETLGVTDGNLGRHLQILEDAGLVAIQKVFDNRRPRTWIKITRTGRAAFRAEVAALMEIVASTEVASGKRRTVTMVGRPEQLVRVPVKRAGQSN
jgi:DNA-binding MarR family transcriptional regulator